MDTEPVDPTDRAAVIAADIKSGALDSEWAAIVNAVTGRNLELVQRNKVGVMWRINWPEHDLDVGEDELLVDEAGMIEKALDCGWPAFRLDGPNARSDHQRALLQVLLRTRVGLDAAAAEAATVDLTLLDLARVFAHPKVVLLPPLDSSATEPTA